VSEYEALGDIKWKKNARESKEEIGIPTRLFAELGRLIYRRHPRVRPQLKWLAAERKSLPLSTFPEAIRLDSWTRL